MLAYILRRIAVMIPMLFVVSVITFIIIQLPPGDYFTTLQAEIAETGGGQDKEVIKRLQEVYGLDQPVYVQYWRWVSGWPRLDFGYSLGWNAPVWNVVGSKLAYTLWLGFLSLVFMVTVSIPIGIYSATHQYSPGDHILSAVGFFGLCLPGFLLFEPYASIHFSIAQKIEKQRIFQTLKAGIAYPIDGRSTFVYIPTENMASRS